MADSLLSDCVEIVMGQSPPGETCNTIGRGFPLLNGPTEYGLHHPTAVQFTTDARKRAQPGDILFCVRGSTTGRMNLADREYAIGRGVAAIRHKKKPELQPFVRAVIEYGLSGLLAQATGSTFPNVSADQLAGLWWPPLKEDEQRAIAHILGTLDDKLEVNRRMDETLEAIAQAIFRSWFVDATTGGAQKSWQVSTIGEICEFVYGKALKEELRRPGTIPVYGSNGQIGWHDEALVKGPGVIIGRKGNPGIVTWAPTDFFPIDTTFYVIPKNECRSLYFLFYALRGHDLAALGADSAVPGLNRNIAYMSKQLVPPAKLLDAFDKQVRPLFERIHHNTEESRTLTVLRDTLLPKLISGELRVPNAKRIIGRRV